MENIDEISFNIRQMTLDDINDVIRGEEEAFGKSLGFDLLYNDLSLNPYAYYFILEVFDKVSGYIGLWINEDEADVINFYVDKKYRGFGLGETLLNFALDVCRTTNTPTLSLEVRRSNQVAINLYEKTGFKYSHDRKRYYDNGEDALVYIYNFEVDK